MNILIIERDKVLYRVLALILTSEGHNIVESYDCDLAIVDHYMNDTNAMRLCKYLSARNIPIIALSASKSVKHIYYNIFIFKPFDLNLLLNTLLTVQH